MEIKKVYINHNGQAVRKVNAKASFLAKAGLVAGLYAGAVGAGYFYETSSRPGRTAITAPQIEAPAKSKPSLEALVKKAQNPAKGRNVLSSNQRKDYAERNVEELQKKGYDAYLEEAIVNGKTFYRTIVSEVSSMYDEAAKLGQDAFSNRASETRHTEYTNSLGQVIHQYDSEGLNSIEKMILKKVNEYNASHPTNQVDFDMARAIAYVESEYNPRAVAVVKKKDETVKMGRGLFQLMPGTANGIAGQELSEKELLNPEINTAIALRYIGYLQNSKHVLGHEHPDKRLNALIAAYNGGEPAILPSSDGKKMLRYENPKNKGYKQTRDYVAKVKEQYGEFKSN